MTEETEIDQFVVKYCKDTRKATTQQCQAIKSDKQKLGEGLAGTGIGCCATGGLGVAAKAAFFKFAGGALVAKFGAICAVVGTGGTALVGAGAVLAAGGLYYGLIGDINKEFLDECQNSHFRRGMAKADWPYVEKAHTASIQVLDGLNKRCPDLLTTTCRCIELVSHERVTPNARSICRYVVQTCVLTHCEDEYDHTFRTIFRESCNEFKRCWQKELVSYDHSGGLAKGWGNVSMPRAGGASMTRRH